MFWDDGPVRPSTPLHLMSSFSNLIPLDLTPLFAHAIHVCGALVLSLLVYGDLKSKNVKLQIRKRAHRLPQISGH